MKGIYPNGQLNCTVNSKTVDILPNQLIKSTIVGVLSLINEEDEFVNEDTKSQLRYALSLLKPVSVISVDENCFTNLKVPNYYKPVLWICRLIYENWITIDKKGNITILDLNDANRLHIIWEKFIN